MVSEEAELAHLLRQGQINGATAVYEMPAGPRALAEIPDLARLLTNAATCGPPVRRDDRTPERIKLSEELAILNRPLEADIEYYDEEPASRWPRRLAVVTALAAAIVAYPLLAPRLGAPSLPSITTLTGSARSLLKRAAPPAIATTVTQISQPVAVSYPSERKGVVPPAPSVRIEVPAPSSLKADVPSDVLSSPSAASVRNPQISPDDANHGSRTTERYERGARRTSDVNKEMSRRAAN